MRDDLRRVRDTIAQTPLSERLLVIAAMSWFGICAILASAAVPR